MVNAALVTLVALGGAEAFAGPAARPPMPMVRHATPTMQFGFGGGGKQQGGVPKGWKKVPSQSRPGQFSYENIKTGQRFDRLPSSEIYDDEVDTVSKAAWNPFAEEERVQQFRSAEEAAGFDENGNDLANSGGIIYLATVPFLLFALSYLGGALGSPYKGGGNF